MIVGVLLAAGAGKRFGGGKLLARLADGTPVGVQAAVNLRDGVDRMVAVIREEDEDLARILAEAGCETLPFREAAQGMGASLAWGVAGSPDADGWLVALADMPWIRTETVSAVSARLRAGAPVTAPVFRGRRGHPVGFGKSFRRELVSLRGDRGARDLLAREAGQIVPVDVEDDGILLDVDELSDVPRPFRRIERKFSL